MKRRRIVLLTLAIPCVSKVLFAQDTTRLLAVGRLWITVQYFHPALPNKSVDWEQSLVDALPELRAATDPARYAAAVNKMLATLHDDQTLAGVGPQNPDVSHAVRGRQQARYYHGLPPFDGSPSPFFSGFLLHPASAQMFVSVDLGEGVFARVPISASPPENTSTSAANVSEASDSPYPEEPRRIAAAYQLWGAVKYFFAYKDLMDNDWDRIFADYLPKFIAANSAREYHLTVAESVSHLLDSNAAAESAELSRYFGEASPEVTVRLVERKPVIVEVSAAATQAGLHVGNIIESIDGEEVMARIKRQVNYLSAGTPPSLGQAATAQLLNGPSGSVVHLKVAAANADSGASGRDVSVPRTATPWLPDEEPPVRTFSNGIGYAAVPRMSSADLESLDRELAQVHAFIFDLRGDCTVDPAVLAQRIAKEPRQALVVTGPIVERPDLPEPGVETATASYFSIASVEPGPHPYAGKVALLIDERTRGTAERAALYLQAAAKPQIFGTPSAGAPAPVTRIRLPGQIVVRFSGQDIRLLNGGQLQRVGVQPSENVPITMAAIRAHRDEPLEHALAALRQAEPVVH